MKAQGPPIRISFVIGSLAVGGAETQLVRLVNGLDRTRFRPSIVCLSRGGELEDSVAPDVPVIKAYDSPETNRRGPSRVIFGVRILSALVRGLRSQHPDVVHAYLPAAYVLGGLAAWLLRVRLIIAGRRGLNSVEDNKTVRWRVLARLANRVIDIHICNSRAVRDVAIAKESISVDRTRVIPNGIDLPALVPQPQLPAEWQSGGVKAAMVANFIGYKGHRGVLEAVALVTKQHPSFRLVLIGDGPERAPLGNLALELGITENVMFAGRRRDAATLVQSFDFTILGSSEEGFPNALMESMAAAVPVVSTAVGGVPELVDDGVQGRLVPYGDTEGMAAAIIWMIEHPNECRQMGEAARRRIAEDFSTERMITSTQAVYEEFLGRHVPIKVAT
jgi:glycosyltransferase involved in cell wall biosynthesis